MTEKKHHGAVDESSAEQQSRKAVAIDTNLLVALRATDLLLTPIQSRDHILITLQYQ